MNKYKIGFTKPNTNKRTTVTLSETFILLFSSLKGFNSNMVYRNLNTPGLWARLGLIDWLQNSYSDWEMNYKLDKKMTFVNYLEHIINRQAAHRIDNLNEMSDTERVLSFKD